MTSFTSGPSIVGDPEEDATLSVAFTADDATSVTYQWVVSDTATLPTADGGFGQTAFGLSPFGSPETAAVPLPPAFVSVEFAWEDGPGVTTPTWYPVPADYLLAWSFRSGRTATLDDSTGPGEATIVLDNSGRDFDPTDATGLGPTKLSPGRPVRLRLTYLGSTRTIWQGIVNELGFRQENYRHRTSEAVIGCYDLLGYAAQFDLDPTSVPPSLPLWDDATKNWSDSTRLWQSAFDAFAAGLTFDQASLLCQAAGVPQAFAGGRIQVPAVGNRVANLADRLRELEQTEQGRVFHDPDTGLLTGITYAELQTRTRSATVQWTLTDEDDGTLGPLRYSSPVLETLPIRNDVVVEVQDVLSTEARQVDAGSIASYGRYTTLLSLASSVAADAQTVADYYVARWSQPQTMVTSLSLDPAGSPALWPTVFDMRLYDRVQLVRRPHNLGSTSRDEYLIEGMQMSGGDGVNVFAVELFLSPIEPGGVTLPGVPPTSFLWSSGVANWSDPDVRWS
jgi:hypothetical protein